MKEKVYIIRKLVKATSVTKAIHKDKITPILDIATTNECWDSIASTMLEQINNRAGFKEKE